MKRPAAAAAAPAAAKSARAEEPADDPFEVRRQLFKAGGLMVPEASYEGPQRWTLAAPGVGDFEGAEPVELTYFAIRALGQLQQLCLEVAGYPYRYTVMTSPYFKEHVKSTLAFGRLPMVKTPGGTEIVQSKAVVRCVAKLCGLAGKSDDEAARCDMLHEMLQTEAKIDGGEVAKLTAAAVAAEAGSSDMKGISRRDFIGFDDAKKAIAALRFWDGLVRGSSSGWLLGGLGDGGSSDLCYVDLAVYWALRTHLAVLEACGFDCLAKFVHKAGDLPGIARLVQSGRLMPNMGEGYVYQGDDLVPNPLGA